MATATPSLARPQDASFVAARTYRTFRELSEDAPRLKIVQQRIGFEALDLVLVEGFENVRLRLTIIQLFAVDVLRFHERRQGRPPFHLLLLEGT
jgi:molybdopterin-guanine dinucleotide biosynthesis protein